jgi:hypothetical protein
VARLNELSKVTHNELIERGLTEEEYALLDQKGYRDEKIKKMITTVHVQGDQASQDAGGSSSSSWRW